MTYCISIGKEGNMTYKKTVWMIHNLLETNDKTYGHRMGS